MSHLDGAVLGVAWILPFAGLLLSIALVPLVDLHLWERHLVPIASAWAVAFVFPAAFAFGATTVGAEVWHALALDYVPFIVLILSLFVVAGGIRVSGNLVGTPGTNTVLLAIGTAMASVFGTTGAAMLLIRPLIQANASRRHHTHVFVFFIFLVANIGGALTPLGDPPLFIGFLKGVDFFWTTHAMALPMALLSLILLAFFYALDRYLWRSEATPLPARPAPRQIAFAGLHNLAYLAGIIAAVLMSGLWHPGIALPIGLGVTISLEALLRDAVLATLTALSWRTTGHAIRIENAFTWEPMREVAILFAAIFITIIPALAMLKAGRAGALAPLLALVTGPDGRPVDAAYFWMTGLLSSFLDNAPTYLVFFNLAGGDPAVLMGPLARTLLAISCGAVFMGAVTYIGNAPNLMVKAICEKGGIRMPGFFGYMLWSGAILLPLFGLVTLVFFR